MLWGFFFFFAFPRSDPSVLLTWSFLPKQFKTREREVRASYNTGFNGLVSPTVSHVWNMPTLLETQNFTVRDWIPRFPFCPHRQEPTAPLTLAIFLLLGLVFISFDFGCLKSFLCKKIFFFHFPTVISLWDPLEGLVLQQLPTWLTWPMPCKRATVQRIP